VWQHCCAHDLDTDDRERSSKQYGFGDENSVALHPMDPNGFADHMIIIPTKWL
jgi:hypothetical protein